MIFLVRFVLPGLCEVSVFGLIVLYRPKTHYNHFEHVYAKRLGY